VTHPATPYQQPVFEVTGPAAVPAALLELARADATAAGYSAGWAQGVSEAREQMAAQVAASRDRAHEFDMERAEALHKALHALDFAAAELEQRAVRSAEQSEDVLLDMAVEIAEALLQRDLRMGDTGSDALARVLALAPVDEPITVRLSPADHAAVTADGMSPQSDSRREIVLVADPELQPGDAMAISGASLIDGRLREGLARVRAVLSR
jgi:flagellar assembly protein FliH